jgi:hypothetical protein
MFLPDPPMDEDGDSVKISADPSILHFYNFIRVVDSFQTNLWESVGS